MTRKDGVCKQCGGVVPAAECGQVIRIIGLIAYNDPFCSRACVDAFAKEHCPDYSFTYALGITVIILMAGRLFWLLVRGG